MVPFVNFRSLFKIPHCRELCPDRDRLFTAEALRLGGSPAKVSARLGVMGFLGVSAVERSSVLAAHYALFAERPGYGTYWTMPSTLNQLAVCVRGLRKAYSDVVAVDDLDLAVGAGECFGLLGPNGAGKTTTIEICEGLLAPDSGTVELLGLTWERDAAELRQRLGVQLQETQLSEKLTVEETIRLFRSFYRRGPAVGEVIAMVQLEEKCGSRVGALSGGQKQRLAMACALVGNPELLFLDEPTTGLDPQARRQVWDLIEYFKTTGRTIILTTHYMDEAERLCGSENGGYELQVSELHRAVPAIFDELARRGIPLTELRTHSATLEDVFVSLTGRHLRDE
jgi:ABC-2 type transport system ATP-binding protein